LVCIYKEINLPDILEWKRIASDAFVQQGENNFSKIFLENILVEIIGGHRQKANF